MSLLIEKSPLFNVRGKFGNTVIKKIRGRYYACAIPSKRKSAPNEKELEQRRKFALAVNIAKSINKIPSACNEWKKLLYKKGSTYNLIFKYVYRNLLGSTPELKHGFSLFPDLYGNPFSFNSVSAENGAVSVDFSSDNFKYIEISKARYIQLNLLFICSEPIDTLAEDVFIFSTVSETKPFNVSDVIEFNVSLFSDGMNNGLLKSYELEKYIKYGRHSLFIAASLLDGEMESCNFSQTKYYEI